MVGIIGIIALLTVLGLSLVITRLAAIALSMTGLSGAAASFQARSAFTGTGFTTSESEQVVSHPVRRRIIMLLMVLRSAGLITIVISLILSFMGTGREQERLVRLIWLAGGVVALLVVAHLPFVSSGVEKVMGWALGRWTDLDVRDYARLLKLSGKYSVMEMQVKGGDWVEGKELRECNLYDEGVTVLGIERADGDYLGVPRGSSGVNEGDTLILYGRSDSLKELDRRRGGGAGDIAHEQAVGDQQRHMARQDMQERDHKRQRRQSDKQTEDQEDQVGDNGGG